MVRGSKRTLYFMLQIIDIPSSGEALSLPNGQLRYFKHFFSLEEADSLFESLLREIKWQQDPIKVFGKTYLQPRLTALYATNDNSYTYSGITMKPHLMIPQLKKIQAAIEAITEARFTTVLLNLYRDGKDSNGWHADDEKELGKNPVIASVSLGSTRYFHLKHLKQKERRFKFLLDHGSLLMMGGPMQHFWQHQIAKTKQQIGPRINLTFRKIV